LFVEARGDDADELARGWIFHRAAVAEQFSPSLGVERQDLLPILNGRFGRIPNFPADAYLCNSLREVIVQVTVVVPCYNEEATVLRLVESVLAAPFDKELVLVDDGSTDGTRRVLEDQVSKLPNVRVFFQDKN